MQRKAIQYLSLFGGPESRQALADIYQASSDPSVKKAVLQAFMIGGEKARLLAAAKGEPDQSLRRVAIQQLGVMGAQDELWQMYGAETSKEAKKAIQQALFVGGSAGRLIELVRVEKDPELRLNAVRNLGLMGSPEAHAALEALYRNETDARTREAVLHAFFVSGNAKRLIEVAKTEKDPAPQAPGRSAPLRDGLARGTAVPAGAAREVKTLAMGLASVVAASLVSAGPPARISAGRLESRDARAGLKPTVEGILREGSGATWIGYAVETDQDGSACCWSSARQAGGCCGGCRLEGERGDVAFESGSAPIALEGPRRLRILLRAEAGRVQQVRAFSEDCALDVGRLPFVWLDDARAPTASITWPRSWPTTDAIATATAG